MTTVAPAPGEVIGDYEILEQIGGNMGLVFKARHRLLEKVVVLKLVPADCIADAAHLVRFQREMRVMGQLEHPNLVPATDARSVGGWHLVVMELIDGVDLQQLIRAQGPLPVAAACEAARQAAQGLQYAHQHGLIHRDIKPSNLMLTRAGTIKVIDMGLALIREDSTAQLTQTGIVMGTMSYCAPEQIRDPSHVDIRADIYSLGCTLYNLLTGKSPYWQRKTFAEVMQAHLHEPFPSLADALPDAPAGLEAVLARMTAKDRDARFSTPSEVVEALEPFARGAELGPLVPERTPQAPPARVKTGKVTSKREGQRRTAGGEQQPKARWTRRAVLLGLLPAIGGTVFLFMNRGKRDSVVTEPNPVVTEPDPLVVVLMDTTAPGGIYEDEEKAIPGGSNAIKLYKILRQPEGPLPSRSLHQEPIYLGWDREDDVRSQLPHLVIIHRSAFFHTENAVLKFGLPSQFPNHPTEDLRWVDLYYKCDKHLIDFIGFVGTAVPRTRFLVYSRGTGPKWLDSGIQEWLAPGFQEDWKKRIEARFPELKDRIFTMTISTKDKEGRAQEGSFRNPETRDLLLTNVIKILGLPKKREAEKRN